MPDDLSPGVDEVKLETPRSAPTAVLGVLLLVNCVVLLGQIWPEGAPPFARGVNIAFLVATLVFFAREIVITTGGGQAAPPSR